MEHVCRRCIRQLLGQPHPRPSPSGCVSTARLLSSTAAPRADNDSPSKSQHVDLSVSFGRQTPSPADQAAYKSDMEKSEAARDYNRIRPRITYDNLPARKIHAYDPADNTARKPRPTPANPQGGALLQRSRPAAGKVLQRRPRPDGGAGGAGGPGGPGRGGARGRFQGRGNNAEGPGRRLRTTDADDEDGDLPQLRGRRGRSQPGMVTTAVDDGAFNPDEDLDDPALDIEEDPTPAQQAAFEREAARLPSDNPTTVQAYNPVPPSLADLEKYWPNTPLSATGLCASVTQQLGPLANRQPSSFWTPLQLAQQFVAGQLVSFHSEREKEETIKFVPQLLAEKAEAVQTYAQIRAERDTNFNADAFLAKRKAARLPDTNPAALPEFVSLTDSRLSAEANEVVVGQMVKGRYEHPNSAADEGKWGKMKWIGEVERKLVANETYTPGDRAKFVGRLTDMVKEMQQQAGKARAKNQKPNKAAQ